LIPRWEKLPPSKRRDQGGRLLRRDKPKFVLVLFLFSAELRLRYYPGMAIARAVGDDVQRAIEQNQRINNGVSCAKQTAAFVIRLGNKKEPLTWNMLDEDCPGVFLRPFHLLAVYTGRM
jgi:hypothetical protein